MPPSDLARFSCPFVHFYSAFQKRMRSGLPIFAGSHDQSLVVKMFHASDPQSANALDAKTLLGPDWQAAMNDKNNNCLGD